MSDFSGRGGGLFFRQGGTSFLSEGHPMGSSILMGEGGIQKNRRMGGEGGGAPIMGNPGHILHVAAVLDTPLILLFDLLRGCIRKLGCN